MPQMTDNRRKKIQAKQRKSENALKREEKAKKRVVRRGVKKPAA